MVGKVRALARQDVNLIQSAQVITTIGDAAKELFENAVDAGARKISLKFTNYGLDCLEVLDDGSGVEERDFETLVTKHATSKLSTFSDLEALSTLGFRGEALSSICALSTLTITTCTAATFPRGFQLTFEHDGTIKEKKSVSATIGTIAKVVDLFAPLPVRRKDFQKNAKRDLINTAKLLQAHAAIRASVRIEAIHFTGKNRLHLLGSNGTTGSDDLRRNISELFGSSLYRILVPIDTHIAFQSTHHRRQGETQIEFHGYLSNLQKEYGQRPERQLTYINSRPCGLPKVLRTINETCSSLGANRSPFVLLNLVMPPDSYDVNVSPDKRTILLHDEQVILEHLRDCLMELFTNDNRSIPMARSNVVEDRCPPADPTIADREASDSEQIEAVSPAHVVADSDEALEGDLAKEDRIKGNLGDLEENDSTSRDGHAEELANAANARVGLADEDSPLPSSSHTIRADELDFQSRPSLKRKRESIADSSADLRPQGADPMSIEKHLYHLKDRHPIVVPHTESQTNNSERESRSTSPEPPEQEYRSTMHSDILVPEKLLHRFDKRMAYLDNSPASYHVHDLRMNLSTGDTTFTRSPQSCTATTKLMHAVKNAGLTGSSDMAERTLSLHVSKSDFFDMTVIGQFNLGFILVMLGKEIFIVDQHASDEKSNYERLLRDTIIQSQTMAQPKELDLSAMERMSIDEHLETLSKNGFEVLVREVDGMSTYSLAALPITKKTTFGVPDLMEILHLLMDGSDPNNVRCTKARRMFASRACRSSIMIGTALTHEKMQEIVRHLGEMDAPWNCPHGRPTMRHLASLEDITSFAAA